MLGRKGWLVADGLPPLSGLVNDSLSVFSVGSDCLALRAEEGSGCGLYMAIVEVLGVALFYS